MKQDGALEVRPYHDADGDAVVGILGPVFRAGETYAVDRDLSEVAMLAYWTGGGRRVFVASDGQGRILGSYYIVRNQAGGGSHVCNCGYVTAADAQGWGVARRMLAESLVQARAMGFAAMQFNFVLESNHRAVRTWLAAGFREIGRVPRGFRHPRLGDVDALILYRDLTQEKERADE